ncbi:MAG: S9 family peptidase [Verrucomicrobia bacterium]|nr:S9 family peptidase [Verrucomicrobiota bacterium]
MSNVAPYGTWHSPITSEWLTMSQKKYGTIVIEGANIYWDELRPSENGRSVVVRYTPEGEKQDMTPENLSVRTRVHEYGGAPFAVHEGKIYFVNDKDQRIYLDTEPLTEPGTRFADLQVLPPYLIAVGEKKDENFLACLHLPTKKWEKIAAGKDFYASPTLSPDGTQLAFLTWDHPQMPWDGTELWVADFKEGRLTPIQKIAGSSQESIFEPRWSPSGFLHFTSDKTGWWNLYRWNEKAAEPLCERDAEFGLPQWMFGMSTYAFAGEKIVAAFVQDGRWSLGFSPDFKPLPLPWTFFTQVRATPEFAVFIAGSGVQDRSIFKYEFSQGKTTVLSHNVHPHLDPGYISQPQFLTYSSSQGRKAHAFYYPPQNKDYRAPEGTLPPLVVMSHGGPTGATSHTFDLKIQYWTSRGIAVLDVDYGGSTGYGRPYRDALKRKWGIVDIEDCEAGAQHLVQQHQAHPHQIAIRGGSAGGYTTLAALTFGKTFTVGASYYGVSDLGALVEETHKFESRYLDSLVGPYPAEKKLYQERSPLFHVDKLKCPVIFFQGAEDLVVPLNQAEKMYHALQTRGITTELIVYEGEQHGFRKSQNIRDSLEKEIAFYLKVWKIAP